MSLMTFAFAQSVVRVVRSFAVLVVLLKKYIFIQNWANNHRKKNDVFVKSVYYFDIEIHSILFLFPQ